MVASSQINPSQTIPKALESFCFELHGLERRRHLASVAITACTLSALLVCTVIAALFIEELVNAPFRGSSACFHGRNAGAGDRPAYFLRESLAGYGDHTHPHPAPA